MSELEQDWTKKSLGESCLIYACGEALSLSNSRQVLALFQYLQACEAEWQDAILSFVPSYCELAIYFDSKKISLDELGAKIDALLESDGAVLSKRAENFTQGKKHLLETTYDGADLVSFAKDKSLSVAEVIQLHSEPEYLVAMIGFKAHFPYLLGLNPILATPRKAVHCRRVPAGSVAIGGEQTGIYPCESPGGWHLLGQTNPELLLSISAGDTVKFIPVNTPSKGLV